MTEKPTHKEPSPDVFTLEPPLSSEEIVKVLARVCIDPLDHRDTAQIATAMVLKGFVER